MAEVARRLYLTVGKVVTVDEAREIMRRAGLPLDTISPEDVFANLPPQPESNRGETTPDDPTPSADASAEADADADADRPDTDEDSND
jgi:hypothetical protein